MQGDERDGEVLDKVKELERWVGRVKVYPENMNRKLRDSAVAAPGETEKRWLFTLVGWEHPWPLESGVYQVSGLRKLFATSGQARQ